MSRPLVGTPGRAGVVCRVGPGARFVTPHDHHERRYREAEAPVHSVVGAAEGRRGYGMMLCMAADRSYIRVKAMLIAPHADGTRHFVSHNAPTSENPEGFHRLIGGSVELGETHREAIIREVAEELGAVVHDLVHPGVVENIFRYDGELGHEIVAVYSGRLAPAPADHGATLTESDGSIVPVEWRPFQDADLDVPLYPAGAYGWIRGVASHRQK